MYTRSSHNSSFSPPMLLLYTPFSFIRSVLFVLSYNMFSAALWHTSCTTLSLWGIRNKIIVSTIFAAFFSPIFFSSPRRICQVSILFGNHNFSSLNLCGCSLRDWKIRLHPPRLCHCENPREHTSTFCSPLKVGIFVYFFYGIACGLVKRWDRMTHIHQQPWLCTAIEYHTTTVY